MYPLLYKYSPKYTILRDFIVFIDFIVILQYFNGVVEDNKTPF